MSSFIGKLCRFGIFVITGVLGAHAQADSPELFTPMLSDPFVYDQEANTALVTKFRDFNAHIEDGWFKHGLKTEVRRLKQSNLPLSADVLSGIVEEAHRALELRREIEAYVKLTGRLAPASLATIARYMENVYVPMLKIQHEARVFEDVQALELNAALFPNFFKDLSAGMAARAPAAVMPAGTSAAHDASLFGESVSPQLNERLKGYAKLLQDAAGENKRMGDIEIEIKKLKSESSGRSSPPKNDAERAKRTKISNDRNERIRILQEELVKLKPKKEPNKKSIVEFFAEASRLTTLQLMLSETHFYRELNDDSTPLEIARAAPACVEKYKELPGSIRFEIASKDERLLNMEMFLANNGLIFSESQYLKEDDFANFFLSASGRDPLKGYMSGMLPFHQLRVAQQGKHYALNEEVGDDWSDLRNPTARPSWVDLGAPAFDDVGHFQDVFDPLVQQASTELQPEDGEDLQRIVTILPPPSGKEPLFGEEGFAEYMDALNWSGVTPYLRDKLKSFGKTKEQWIFAIPQDVFFALGQNKIEMEFPPFYGPEPYKQWALRLLYKAISRDSSNGGILESLCRVKVAPYAAAYGAAPQVDTSPHFSAQLCSTYKTNDDLVANLKTSLAPFEDRGPFIPPTLSYSQNLRESWGDLRQLWRQLLASGNLSNLPGESSPIFNEFSFINGQFGVNPWVMMRLSVLTAAWELSHGTYVPHSVAQQKPELVASAPKRRGRGGVSPADVKVAQKRTRLGKALALLPLADFKRPVRPMYANSLYSRSDEGWKFWKGQDEKDYFRLWDKIEQRYHDDNAHIFKTRTYANWDHYGFLERLETKSLLTHEDVEAVIRGYRLEQEGSDPKEMRELLALAESSEDAAKFDVIKKIMDSPGQLEEHQKILDAYITTQGREDDFDDPTDVKLAFLKRDTAYKYPLMTQIMKIAARKRSAELEKNMQELCRLDP
ncbi:MAG: hypothetical protein ABIR96_06745, partial [Bdellovibrionota bacterium]